MFRAIIIQILILTGFHGLLQAQDSISLSWCLEKAAQNHVRAGNDALYDDISALKIQNIKSGNLPQMELNGKASYQSDAIGIDMDIPIPGLKFPVSPKDQYKLSLDITQSIYDGGISKNRQKAEQVSLQLDKSQLELDIRTSKMQVKDLYFSLLLIQQNKKIVELSLSQLLDNKKVVEAGIKNGVLLNTDLDLLDVEILKLQQKEKELENSYKSGLEVLSLKTGEDLSRITNLQQTDFQFAGSDSLKRIEEELFGLQTTLLENNKAVLKSKSLPKLFAFGQFGYGNPALNMLKDEFDTYYVVGAGLKWTLWDWNSTKHDRNVLGLQQEVIKSRQLQFESDIKSALMNQLTDIRNHEENIKTYESILNLRIRITSTSKAQLAQGIIKTLDYITVFNQETLARIQFENEKTLLQQSIAKYLEINGEL